MKFNLFRISYRLTAKRYPGPLPGSFIEWPVLVRRKNWLEHWRLAIVKVLLGHTQN